MERNGFMQIGNYIELADGMTIGEAKAKLFDGMVEQLREVAQDERFWIVKEEYNTVGWKLGVVTIPVEKKITVKREDGTVLKVIKFGGNA